MSVPPDLVPRPRHQVMLDICCEIECQMRHKRLFDRIHGGTLVLTFLLAGGAVGASASSKTGVLAIMSALLLVATAWESAFDFPRRAVMHGIQRERYLDLKSVAHTKSTAELDAERAQIHKSDPPEYFAVAVEAQNTVLRSEGHEREMHAHRNAWERILAWLA